MKVLLDFLALKDPVDPREPMEQLDRRETEVPLDKLDPQDLLVSFLSSHLTSFSRETPLHPQDQKEKPEEMPSSNKPDLKRTAMLI